MKNDENQNIVDIETLYKNEEEAVGLPEDPRKHHFVDCELVPTKAFEIDERRQYKFYIREEEQSGFIRFLFSQADKHFKKNYSVAIENIQSIYDDGANFPKVTKLLCLEEMIIILREYENKIKEIQAHTELLFEDDGIEPGKVKMVKKED